MWTRIRTKAFAVGFSGGLILLVAVNIYEYTIMIETECFDCLLGFGFPFRLYESGIFHLERILWLGLIADVLIAILVSVGIGLLCHSFKNIRGERLS
jgi:hypothetical protein